MSIKTHKNLSSRLYSLKDKAWGVRVAVFRVFPLFSPL